MVRLLSSPVWGCFKDRRVSHESTAEHDKRCRLTSNGSSTGDQHRMRPLLKLVMVSTLSCSPYRHACYCTAAHLSTITNDGFRQQESASCRSQLLRQIPTISSSGRFQLTSHVAVILSGCQRLCSPLRLAAAFFHLQMARLQHQWRRFKAAF